MMRTISNTIKKINSILFAVFLFITQFLNGAVNVHAQSLSTAILDNFNRTNGPIGANWGSATSGYSIASNYLDVGSGDNAIFWGTQFEPDQEAFFTMTTIDLGGSEQDLLLKSQSRTTWVNGVIEVLYDSANKVVQVWTYSSAQGWVQRGANILAVMVNGDQLGARAKANGIVEVYRNGTLLGSRDVSSWTYAANGGYIGLWFINAGNAVADDFGGGTVAGGSTSTPLPPTSTSTPTGTSTSAPTRTSTFTPIITSTNISTLVPTVGPTQTRTQTPVNTPTFTPTSTATASLIPSTATPSPTRTTTFTSTSTATIPVDLIFKDGFESGGFLAWTTSVSDNGSLSADVPAALTGSVGLSVNINDNNAIYVQDDLSNGETRYRARFYFDPNSITMSNGNAHYLFYGYSGTSTAVVRVEFRRSSNTYQVRISLVNDGTTWTNTSWFTITDAQHFVELDWRSSSAVGANNGGVTFWIDGTQRANLTGIDNDTRRIDRSRLGAVAGIDTATRGTEYFDAFESRRASYIGADISAPLPTSTLTAASFSPTPIASPTSTFVNSTNTATVTPNITITSTITNTPTATPGVTATLPITTTPMTGVIETFENAVTNWVIEMDGSGTGSTVTRSSAQNRSGTYSAAVFTTNNNSKAQVRDVISSPWSGVPSSDPGEFFWQHAYVYVPSATANALTGSEYLDLAGFYVSSSSSGWYLRLKASGALYASGPYYGTQNEFNIYSKFPLDQWVEVEIGLWSQNIEAGGRSFIVLINGDVYGWYRMGMDSANYDRVAMGILNTNSNDDLTVYLDDWNIYEMSTHPVGSDNRLVASSTTIDFTAQSGKNIDFQYGTWKDAGSNWQDATHGIGGFRSQAGPNSDLQRANLESGWAEIVLDWQGGLTPAWPPNETWGTNYFASMVAFKKYFPDEENLELVFLYNYGGSGTTQLAYESWTTGPVIYARWEIPEATTTPGAHIPEPGDKVRVRWEEMSATNLKVTVDYYDASTNIWYYKVIDDTRNMSNSGGVNWLDHKHNSVSITTETTKYSIRSISYGTLATFPSGFPSASVSSSISNQIGIIKPLILSSPEPQNNVVFLGD
jgi:hypothetical protein